MTNEFKDLSFLELFIINTITYFDIFDYPLTLNEIYQYLYTGGMLGGDYSINEIKEELINNPKLQKVITTSGGFYFVKGRQEIIKIRLERYRLAEKKFSLVLKAVNLIKFIPFIKLVSVCNNLAGFNAKKESDIDLFIIVKEGRLWLTRLVLVFLIAVLGLRPPKEKVQDKLCLSFYVTNNNLDLSQIKIATDDIYLTYWLATLFPVYQREDYYNKLMQTNSWLSKYLPEYERKKISLRYKIEDTRFSKWVYQTKEKFLSGIWGDWFEGWTKSIQLKKISQKKKDIAVSNKNWVVMSDEMLKFHEDDRRMVFLEKFETRRKEVINKI